MADNDFSSVLAAVVMRRIRLPKFVSASGSADSVKIGEIKFIGDATVDHVDIKDVETKLDTGAASLKAVETIVSLRIRFTYSVVGFSGSVQITTPSFLFPVGDVDIPALNNIELNIDSATLENVQASLESVKDLDLGGGAFSGLALDNTVLPTAGFGLGGLSLGTLNLNEVSVPAVSSARLSIEEFSLGNQLLIPSISVKDIELPSVSAPDVTSEAPIVVPNITSQEREIELIDRWFLSASIFIEPTFTMLMRALVIEDISATSTIKNIDIRDIQSTVQVFDITLEGLELNSVELESITTAS